MTKIKLIRSGWLAGIILTAETEAEMAEDDVRRIAYAARPTEDKLSRDAILHTLIINDKEEIPVDLEQLRKSELKEIIELRLENKLKNDRKRF